MTWVDEEDYRGVWQRWEPSHLGDWPTGDGVPEQCCEGIVCRRKVPVSEPPETLSPELRARLETMTSKDGECWRYEVFHAKHNTSSVAPSNPAPAPTRHVWPVVPKVSTSVLKAGTTQGDAFEEIDHKRRASGE